MSLSKSEGYFQKLYEGVDAFKIFYKNAERLGLRKKTSHSYDSYGLFGSKRPIDREPVEPDSPSIPDKSSFAYGEIQYRPFRHILKSLDLTEGGAFYDLGTGSGKPVFTAALSCNFQKLYGVEYIPAITRLAKRVLKKYNEEIRPQLPKKKQSQEIKFVNSDFLKYDFSDASVVFIPSTTFNEKVMAGLTERFIGLKPGSYIITLDRTLPENHLRSMFHMYMATSWSSNTEAYVYKRRWKEKKIVGNQMTISKKPKSFLDVFNLANRLYSTGDYGRALKYYGTAIRKNNHSFVYFNRALTYMMLKKYDRALSDINKILKRLDPKKDRKHLAEVHYLKGLLYEKTKRNNKRILACYNTSLELTPRYKIARTQIKNFKSKVEKEAT